MWPSLCSTRGLLISSSYALNFLKQNEREKVDGRGMEQWKEEKLIDLRDHLIP